MKSTPREAMINRTAQIMTRLERQALNDLKLNGRGSDAPMTELQIRAADIILKKRVPDLQRTTLTGDPEAPLDANLALGLDDKLLEQLAKRFDGKF